MANLLISNSKTTTKINSIHLSKFVVYVYATCLSIIISSSIYIT